MLKEEEEVMVVQDAEAGVQLHLPRVYTTEESVEEDVEEDAEDGRGGEMSQRGRRKKTKRPVRAMMVLHQGGSMWVISPPLR